MYYYNNRLLYKIISGFSFSFSVASVRFQSSSFTSTNFDSWYRLENYFCRQFRVFDFVFSNLLMILRIISYDLLNLSSWFFLRSLVFWFSITLMNTERLTPIKIHEFWAISSLSSLLNVSRILFPTIKIRNT